MMQLLTRGTANSKGTHGAGVSRVVPCRWPKVQTSQYADDILLMSHDACSLCDADRYLEGWMHKHGVHDITSARTLRLLLWILRRWQKAAVCQPSGKVWVAGSS